ncbi:hypothetical protein [Pediococcus pentosaceus]|jgi:hypothetical protein|uniref:Uncharacterized protein n=2 Tax=Pediococcus pentosaceus TaxID=1255 RepID=A0ABD7X6F7_PEDPE|nr:hypothetical protein [Pediococcus pentosaceus]MBZ5943306.1 hypothetical protein [Weissella cibaria]ANI97944.1 hypothetical protein AN278_005380 [Pediococcus pentosaceus]ASC08541.1 hypothetical protein S100194_01002 [Pediococcus pentosaceus]AXR43422.1 hypothetical protein CKK51_04590 [Pediococcus pentosaceus]KAF0422270.1 hypothetical protein GBO84_02770 [Pediococcus pentosaceus]
MNQFYQLTYWGWNSDDLTKRKLRTKMVKVPASTIDALTNSDAKKTLALRFIDTNDEYFVLNAGDFHSLEKVNEN